MPRFYLSQPLNSHTELTLPENIVRHIYVLRLKIGDEITLFNGNGNEFTAILQEINKRQATCFVQEARYINRESPLNITLVQAISSGERMDFTLQKGVELGVKTFLPIISERCVVKLSGERAEKRVARWQEIVIAACEQSGRNIVPKVLPIITFKDYLKQIDKKNLHLIMSLNRAQKLRDFTPLPENIDLMIGPEGGWTTAEENAAFAAGVQSLTLGQRILRTETASLAAVAAMQTLWGDF